MVKSTLAAKSGMIRRATRLQPAANAMVGASVLAVSMIASASAFAANTPAVQPNAAMNTAVTRTLETCKWASDNCRTAINHAWAALVFPVLHKADLGAGGAGVNGAMVEDGRVTGYYTLDGGSTVPPPNIDGTGAVFAFERDDAVTQLKSREAWNVGATPDVRLITENTGDVPPTANVEAFIFDRSGLHNDISLRDFNVRKTSAQPKQVNLAARSAP
jgi:hypothetical protein